MTAILGGGISGLSAAYYCLENPKLESIILYEASNRLGGWIKSITSASGVIFEKGPRTIRPTGPAGENTLELVEKLKLADKVIPINLQHPAARNRMIYANEKLHLLPNSISSLFKTSEPFKRRLISIIWNDLNAKHIKKDDESIYDFVERRFGRDVADYLISPMICGICAGDPQKISVHFLMSKIFQLEQKHGSITKGLLNDAFSTAFLKEKAGDKVKDSQSRLTRLAKEERWSVWGLKEGLEQLPTALRHHLSANPQLRVDLNTKCEKIRFKKDYAEVIIKGEPIQFKKVISALSAKSLAPLLEEDHPQLSRELAAIPSTTVAVVNLHYAGDVLPVEAFGFLVPPKEKLPILGVIFDSCVFKKGSDTVLTVMMGGAWFDKYFGNKTTKDEFLSIAVNQTKKILNIKENPVDHDVAVLEDCIPQYLVGHKQRLQHIENYISKHKIPLALCGSSYHGVGLNDVILSAKQAVSQIS
ncbi:hypothetical protein QAD02_001943 [Eretmocerus hayati]|uniref:Uncharacterized protein n=1 Tax=Eretmocerus hayati TaxID=131215 RepID=A0ACC2NK45_9HYME|nr:hypothetical protein QAD02_001943 [Eretmocerus hayati]